MRASAGKRSLGRSCAPVGAGPIAASDVVSGQWRGGGTRDPELPVGQWRGGGTRGELALVAGRSLALGRAEGDDPVATGEVGAAVDRC